MSSDSNSTPDSDDHIERASSCEDSFCSLIEEDVKVIFDTSKYVLTEDRQSAHIDSEVRPSKVAPRYLREMLDNRYGVLHESESSKHSLDESLSSPFDSDSGSIDFCELSHFKTALKNEAQLGNIYALRANFSTRFDNRSWLHPDGMTNFEYSCIPPRKKEMFENFKNQVRKENHEYMAAHPEINAIISLGVKKLLADNPPDGADYLADYFSTKIDTKKFEDQMADEQIKLSRFHRNKMLAEGKLKWKTQEDKAREDNREFFVEGVLNAFKRMNIGPLAQDMCFGDPSGICTKKPDEEPIRRKKKKVRTYCGCKDWKLKKSRCKQVEASRGDGKGETPPISNQKKGMVDTEKTYEDTEEETEDEMYEMGLDVDEMSEAEVERLATILVDEFFTMTQPGHNSIDRKSIS